MAATDRTTEKTRGGARVALLDAALRVIRSKGYAATTVDDICAAAGRTKGAFFHHFAGKEALAVAAADHWSETTGAMFAKADYHALADPAARVLGYLDLRAALLAGEIAEFTCLVGTMVQEAYDSSPAIRAATAASILGHAATLEADIAAALGPGAEPGLAASLARHTQGVIQGGFILAKATGGPEAAAESIGHLRRYFEFLFAEARTGAPGRAWDGRLSTDD